jgi:2-(1,2-epoxy-1,2-dihydrophenyl)acetyl-CoA isomerase
VLRIEITDGIATLTLDRPRRLNALSWALMARLREELCAADANPGIRAIILTGAGRAFSSGLDLHEIDTQADTGARGRSITSHMAASVSTLAEAMLGARVPVVAAVNGPCVGGSVGLALLADVAVAARSAYFQIPHVANLHLVPDLGLTWALPRQVGRARPLGMSLTGQRVPAEQAAAWGLIWDVVDDEALPDRAQAIARDLACRAAPAVATRQLIDSGVSAELSAQLRDEIRHQGARFTQREVSEAVSAFTRHSSSSPSTASR